MLEKWSNMIWKSDDGYSAIIEMSMDDYHIIRALVINGRCGATEIQMIKPKIFTPAY
jgi:hypothetical protein